MKFIIAHDLPGRVRLRCGEYAFTLNQSYGIENVLSQNSYIKSVTVSHITGSILVYYQNEFRENVLDSVAQIKLESLPVIDLKEIDQSKTIDYDFRKKILWKIGAKLFRSIFMPSPLRAAFAVWKSVRFIRKGLKSLANFKVDVAVLDGTAISILLAQRSYSTANSIMFLLSISELLETYTRKKSRGDLARSLAINVDSVWLSKDNCEVLIPMEKLCVGDEIVVRTGAIIPVDGTVTAGEALVNQASMTGEHLPVLKSPGATVFAGTALEDGFLKIEVKALGSETRINEIIDLIDKSESLKAGIQSRAENLADSIVPFSFLSAAAVFLFTGNLTKALSVLLVDFSCAIKIATPISVISAMREAANRKIMVKGGKFLEAIAEADTIVFDKTGTLTIASPVVNKVVPFDGYSRFEVLKIAACLEEHFPHSVARAVVKKAVEEGIEHLEEHADIEYILAHGISSYLNNKKALIGSYHFIFEDEKIPISEAQKLQIERESGNSSTIFLAVGGKLAGFLCIDDPIRREAAAVIEKLRLSGIKSIIMLTGDSETAASVVATELGIDEYQSQVLPDNKAKIIEQLKKNGKKIIMVGDGVNDSPALAAAHVSVSMKDSSDIAREVADITLLSSDLNELIMARLLGQKLIEKIKDNYNFIIGFNSTLLVLSIFGFISPGTSALFHNVSTMAVSVRSMRFCLKD